ncbi:MAG: glycosyltransferase family 2 protein [Capsulimonadaceae bacterium]|nr:glycosyltransferase family 2 protein [Capsulimonadaceae bacterium]
MPNPSRLERLRQVLRRLRRLAVGRLPDEYLLALRVYADLAAQHAIVGLLRQIDLLKSKIEIPAADWQELQEIRRSTITSERPLVSVCVATHNRARLLTERCLPSILKQTYHNLEIIVVGEDCSDDTATAVANLRDERIRLHFIERQPPHLDEPERRWMVAGSRPNNVAQALAIGDYITFLDDDDEHLPERIEQLVGFAVKENADFVYHPFWAESPTGEWDLIPANMLKLGQVTTSSIFYRRWLKHLQWDVDSHLLGEPNDWNYIRRVIYLGAKCVRYPEPLLRHYRERNQSYTRSADLT